MLLYAKMTRVEAFSSEASRQDAHNLDDQRERHKIRREGKLWVAEDSSLNEFEKLVREGKIRLLEPPVSISEAQVGEDISLDRGYIGYSAYLRSYEKSPAVDMVDLKKPTGNTYSVVYQGPVLEIKYRHPESNKKQVASSSLIEFTVLEKTGGIFQYEVAFYNPLR